MHYHFVSNADFDVLVATDGLLEWATVHGRDRYGTPSAPVEAAVERGERVILEIDLQGARQVRESAPDAFFVFLSPPSWDELVSRLRGRGTESDDVVARRLETARVELAAVGEFDVVIVNDDVQRTCDELVSLLVGRPDESRNLISGVAE